MSDYPEARREASEQARTLIHPQGTGDETAAGEATSVRAERSDAQARSEPPPRPPVSPHPYASALAAAAAQKQARLGPRRETLLYLDGVTKSFDGFKAIDNLSLVVERGEMRAIIGPNGAGKTTMMDIVTGKTRPDRGDVYFAGDIDLTRHDEPSIAAMGIGRKFQKPTVFEGLSIRENLLLAMQGPRSVLTALFHRGSSEEAERIDEILATTRLTARCDESAAALSHGQKQWLEIGMLLAQDPLLLLVDEPVAGMTDAETEETARLLREIAETRSVVVVEHDMAFVRMLGVKVTCLHEGRVLSEGTLDHVSSDPKVIEVYLGR